MKEGGVRGRMEEEDAGGARWYDVMGRGAGRRRGRRPRGRKKKKGRRGKRRWSRDLERNRKGTFERWKGMPAKKEKRIGWLQKGRGWERKTARGNPRVWS